MIFPYAREVQAPVDAALRELAPHAERVDVSGSPTSYYELLSRLWAEGEGFVVLEHDIQLTPEALREAEECPCSWGVAPYVHPVAAVVAGGGRTIANISLGCTRFSTELLRAHPDAWDDDVTPPQWRSHAWGKLDSRIAGVLMLAGVAPHEHSPVPHWRRWRPAELRHLAATAAIAQWRAGTSPEARLEAERLRQVLEDARTGAQPLAGEGVLGVPSWVSLIQAVVGNR